MSSHVYALYSHVQTNDLPIHICPQFRTSSFILIQFLFLPKMTWGMFGWVDFREDGKKEWKIGEKMSGKGVWLRGGGGEKSGGAQLFSFWAHQNSISPKWRENEEECVGQNCPSPFHGQLFVFFYFCLSVVFFFFLDKILHNRRFFLFVFICFFFF